MLLEPGFNLATQSKPGLRCIFFPDLSVDIFVTIPPQGCSATLYRSVDGGLWENINGFDSSGSYNDTLPPGSLSAQYRLDPFMFGVARPSLYSQYVQFPP